jgi:dihydroneopterin aldolase
MTALPNGEGIEVRVHDLRLAARIGAHAHEMDRRQMLRVMVSLRLKLAPLDQLSATIDYEGVVALAEALANEHIVLIETFCARLASDCLAAGPVDRVEVIVEKPGALVNGVASARAVCNAG